MTTYMVYPGLHLSLALIIQRKGPEPSLTLKFELGSKGGCLPMPSLRLVSSLELQQTTTLASLDGSLGDQERLQALLRGPSGLPGK